METLSDEELIQIRAHAAEAAMRGDGKNPYPDGSERAKAWNDHFIRALSALNE